jgi:hypothetical protein
MKLWASSQTWDVCSYSVKKFFLGGNNPQELKWIKINYLNVRKNDANIKEINETVLCDLVIKGIPEATVTKIPYAFICISLLGI